MYFSTTHITHRKYAVLIGSQKLDCVRFRLRHQDLPSENIQLQGFLYFTLSIKLILLSFHYL